MRCTSCNRQEAVYFAVHHMENSPNLTCEDCEQRWLRVHFTNTKNKPADYFTYFDTYEELQLELIKRRL